MNALSLKEIRGEKFPFHINRNNSTFRLKDLILGPDYRFDFEVFLPSIGMNLQRDLVWTQEQKAQLILSILKGIRIPPMTFVLQKDRLTSPDQVWEVIDGKQRLTAMIEYLNFEFAIRWKGRDYYFGDLPRDCKQEILNFEPIADIGYSYPDRLISDADKIRWFELINFAGTPQDAEHFDRLKKAISQLPQYA